MLFLCWKTSLTNGEEISGILYTVAGGSRFSDKVSIFVWTALIQDKLLHALKYYKHM